MTEQVRVIELDKTELKPGAKYIFFYDKHEAPELMAKLRAALNDLIGSDQYILGPKPEGFKAYEVLPKDEKR